jgi:hypothetical protein
VTSESNNIANSGLRPLAAIQDGTLIHHSLSLVPISLPKMSVPVHFIPMTISIKATENTPKQWTDFSKCSNSNPRANLSHPIFNVLHDVIQFFPSVTLFYFQTTSIPHGINNYLSHFWNRVLSTFTTKGRLHS